MSAPGGAGAAPMSVEPTETQEARATLAARPPCHNLQLRLLPRRVPALRAVPLRACTRADLVAARLMAARTASGLQLRFMCRCSEMRQTAARRLRLWTEC